MTGVTELQRRLAAVLDDLDRKIVSGELPEGVLEDLKSKLDEVRTGVLAFITTVNPADYEHHARRYRLRRASQICQNVLAGMADGTIGPQTRGFEQFMSIAEETRKMLGQLR